MSREALAKAGDICQTCYKIWVHKGMKPKKLCAVMREDGRVMTTETGIPIVACPYCDGEPIFMLKKPV